MSTYPYLVNGDRVCVSWYGPASVLTGSCCFEAVSRNKTYPYTIILDVIYYWQYINNPT